MAGRLLVVNTVVGLLACLLVAGLTRELLAARPLPPPPSPRSARPASVEASAPAAPSAPTAYGVIAAKNLFSPSRSETPAVPTAAAGPKPVLHGVVMDGPKSRAYLEDPVVKRTFGYAVGDSIGGGRLESIGADRVVIARADGLLEVLLQDPSKPKVTPATAGQARPIPPADAAPSTPGPTAASAETPAPPVAPSSRVLAPGSRTSER